MRMMHDYFRIVSVLALELQIPIPCFLSRELIPQIQPQTLNLFRNLTIEVKLRCPGHCVMNGLIP